jgi:hypothetical protein
MVNVRRSPLLSRVKNEDLRRAASAIFDLADNVASRSAALAKDSRFTAEGRVAEISEALRTSIEPKLRELQQPIVRQMQEIERRTRALSLPAPDPANTAAALERQEIRAMLRAMPLAERSDLVFKTKDERIIEAVLCAPCELSGLPADRFEVLINRTREAMHPDEVAAIEELQADLEEVRMCISVATGDMQRDSGIAEDRFAKLMGRDKTGSPWLVRDGDRVLVVRLGETNYPIANAEECATGKFYSNAAAYWADRPDGERPVPVRENANGNGIDKVAIEAALKVATA